MIERNIHYRCRPAGAGREQLRGPGLKPSTGTSVGGKLVESGLHELSKVGHACLQRDQTRVAWRKH